jgi:hypothetical protein
MSDDKEEILPAFDAVLEKLNRQHDLSSFPCSKPALDDTPTFRSYQPTE